MKNLAKYISIGVVFVGALFCVEAVFCLLLAWIVPVEVIEYFFSEKEDPAYRNLLFYLILTGTVFVFIELPLIVATKYKKMIFKEERVYIVVNEK